MNLYRPRITVLALTVFVLVVAVTTRAASGLTLVVTKTADTADGSCDVVDCSLREALIAANFDSAEFDTIVVPAGFYALTIADASPGADEDSAETGDLDIRGTGGILIQGAGADVTTIDATGLGNRVFHVVKDFSSSPVGIEGVRVSGGDVSSLSQSYKRRGSGIWVEDRFPVVELDDVVVADNVGDGVYSVAILDIDECTFSGNTGSGLHLNEDGYSKRSAIEDSSFVENGGAGLLSARDSSSTHTFDVLNSTFSGNNTAMGAFLGAITTLASGTVEHVTISDDDGWGLSIQDDFFSNASVILRSSILADNALGNVLTGTDFALMPLSGGTNVLDDGGAGAFVATDDQTFTDPLLSELGDHGGLTLTYDLTPGSPAIDTARPANCPPLDQRGQERPVDGDGDQQPDCDVGAVEFVPEPSALAALASALSTLGVLARRRLRL